MILGIANVGREAESTETIPITMKVMATIMTTIMTTITIIITTNHIRHISLNLIHIPRYPPILQLANQASFAVIVRHRLFRAPGFAMPAEQLSRWSQIAPRAALSYLQTHPSAHNVAIIMDKASKEGGFHAGENYP